MEFKLKQTSHRLSRAAQCDVISVGAVLTATVGLLIGRGKI